MGKTKGHTQVREENTRAGSLTATTEHHRVTSVVEYLHRRVCNLGFLPYHESGSVF